MQNKSIIVRADWDADASVWVATSADIDGLATEADTFEELTKKIITMVGELLELNAGGFDLAEIPVHIMAAQMTRVPNPSFN